MNGDLVVLVPDRNTEATIEGVLMRRQSLQIAPISFRILVHPEKDPGCRLHGHELLRIHAKSYRYALLVFDWEGSGGESLSPETLEAQAGELLRSSEWQDRAMALVLRPELDIWIWSDSPVVEEILGWTGRSPALREWLARQGFKFGENGKPVRPKEALQAARDAVRKPRSSAMYKELALRVSLDRCVDPAFVKLREQLRAWFGQHS